MGFIWTNELKLRVENKERMYRYYIGLGSNLGNRRQHLRDACHEMLQEGITILKGSSLYRSEPWGFASDEPFLNAVLCVRCAWEPDALLQLLKQLEQKAGRVHLGNGYQNRPLDLDILVWEHRIWESEHLSIPHRALEKRSFVVIPMLELEPDWMHPKSGEFLKDVLDINTLSAELQLVEDARWWIK